jgi:hypothetical protein
VAGVRVWRPFTPSIMPEIRNPKTLSEDEKFREDLVKTQLSENAQLRVACYQNSAIRKKNRK